MKIKEIAQKEIISAEDILYILIEVGNNKDIIIIKNDGVRDNASFSVIIICSNDPEKSFRCDDASLFEAVKVVLRQYVKERY